MVLFSEFTEEDFEKFVFPKPLQELEVIPEKLATTIKPKHGSKHCEVCNEDFPNHQRLKEHFFVTHTIHYVCPVENCKHVVAKLDTHRRQFELARHIWGHDHEHPQLSMPHECIGKLSLVRHFQNRCKQKGLSVQVIFLDFFQHVVSQLHILEVFRIMSKTWVLFMTIAVQLQGAKQDFPAMLNIKTMLPSMVIWASNVDGVTKSLKP